ncbi:uncharacterized protein LOC107270963 [Cephus cinctus]|uniref:Uncharacterized protein LOC107270963 n=1 Tax=Cephus cinctus TaxID=211228 RepID=A0AAJ7C4U4_CEPCN|nr:uncharacterized protein LOC107270963 [Cephus cinctus]
MKGSIVMILLAIVAILQACRAIPVRIHENNVDLPSAVAYFIPPVDNSINIPHSELRNTIHSKTYPVPFLSSFIYPYGSLRRPVNIPPYLNDIISGNGRLHRPYPSPVVITFPAPDSGYENGIESSDESSSDSSDESFNISGEASTDEIHEPMTTDETSLQSTTTTTTEPSCITATISTTEKPTTVTPSVKSSSEDSNKL